MTTPTPTEISDAAAEKPAPKEPTAGKQTKPDRSEPGWAERAPFTAAFVRQFDAARSSLTERINEGQKSLDELHKKAWELVGQVQARVDKVGDKVREEGKEASEKLDEVRSQLAEKLPLRIDLQSWLRLPEHAREEILAALGVASDKKVAAVHANIDKLREDITVLTEAQTVVLKELIGAGPHKPASRKTTVRKSAGRKSTATRKTAARKTATKLKASKPAEA